MTQIDEVTVTMTSSGPGGQGRAVKAARSSAPDSGASPANEVVARVRTDGQFEIIEWLGSLAKGPAFGNDPSAPFMVPGTSGPSRKSRTGGRPAAVPARV